MHIFIFIQVYLYKIFYEYLHHIILNFILNVLFDFKESKLHFLYFYI